jgi:hypothetical protein
MRKARGGSFALWPATRYQGSLRLGNRDQETIGLGGGGGDPAGFGQKPKEAPPSLLTFVWMDVLKARRYQIRKGKGKKKGKVIYFRLKSAKPSTAVE